MAGKSTSCSKAIQLWEEKNQQNPTEAEIIKLIFQIPPIEKMDAPILNTLVKCKHLSLSSNCIDKMINLPNLRNLEILSLARNNIKKISGLEEVGATLRELWLSYNFIERLDNLQSCVKLETLYISNNKIKNWEELDKIKDLPEIANVLFVGNPIYDGMQREDAKFTVLKRIPKLKNVDGTIISESIREKIKEMDAAAEVASPLKK